MKTITILTVLALAPIALAHPDHEPKPEHPADHPEHPGDHPEHPSDSDAAKNTSEEAIALLGKVHEAYKNAIAIQETVTITMPAMMPGEELETMEVNTWLGADSGQIIAEEEMTATWVDGKFYLTIGEKEDAYIEQDATSFGDGLQKATGGEGMPGLWTVSMREDDNIDDWLATFSMGMPGTELVGVTAQTQEDGTEVEVIELKTMMGTLAIAVTVRERFLANSGVPALLAVDQDNSTHTVRDIALAWASGIGSGRVGVIESTFKDETETDLFGEQAIIVGGLVTLIKASYETLVDAGYPPQLAYIECCHEVKQVADIIYEKGVASMMDSISNTAEMGAYEAINLLDDEHLRSHLRTLLKHIQEGTFAQRLINHKIENKREELGNHEIEQIGKEIRSLMHPDVD